jgi:hypothetical protein
MSVKWFCDECGKEMGDSRELNWYNRTTLTLRDYEIASKQCSDCILKHIRLSKNNQMKEG